MSFFTKSVGIKLTQNKIFNLWVLSKTVPYPKDPVTGEYVDLKRIRDKNGKPIHPRFVHTDWNTGEMTISDTAWEWDITTIIIVTVPVIIIAILLKSFIISKFLLSYTLYFTYVINKFLLPMIFI